MVKAASPEAAAHAEAIRGPAGPPTAMVNFALFLRQESGAAVRQHAASRRPPANFRRWASCVRSGKLMFNG